MDKWEELAGQKIIEKTVSALKDNGIDAQVVENGNHAKEKVLEIIPPGAEVMDMTSMTLDTISLVEEINESGRFDSVRKKLDSMDKTQRKEKRCLGCAPDFAVGSVHAVTANGEVLIASASGSQLPAYVYSAGKVIWVVGTQKIVRDIDEGIKRIYEYCLPLEDERAKRVYGVGSAVNKLLIVNRESSSGRISLIFVKEKLGF